MPNWSSDGIRGHGEVPAHFYPSVQRLSLTTHSKCKCDIACTMQVQVSIEMASRLVSRAVRISNSQQRPGSRMINPITFINLAGCSGIPGQSDAQLVAYCIQLCPNLRELQACRTSNGRAKATLPLSADGALQVLRACKTHTKVRRCANTQLPLQSVTLAAVGSPAFPWHSSATSSQAASSRQDSCRLSPRVVRMVQASHVTSGDNFCNP